MYTSLLSITCFLKVILFDYNFLYLVTISINTLLLPFLCCIALVFSFNLMYLLPCLLLLGCYLPASLGGLPTIFCPASCRFFS